jgi:rare lipoprotein A
MAKGRARLGLIFPQTQILTEKMKKPVILRLYLLLCLTACACGRHHIIPVEYPSNKRIVLPEKTNGRGFTPYIINGEKYYPLPDAEGFVQYGKASWYGEEFHGRPTSSGEIFDMYRKSAAHKTLPLGTYVKTVNLSNNKEIVVRINDRGPFVKGRVIDLSYAAAKEIGLTGPGVAEVMIAALGREVGEVKSPSGVKPIVEITDLNRGEFTVQVGAFKIKKNAFRLSDRMKVIFDYVDVAVCDDKDQRPIYRVRVSKSKTLTEAEKIEKELEAKGFEEAFIVSL